MGFQSYVSEAEAAQMSGVGIATLRRFVEAGHLKSERDSDGLPLFSTADLIGVFGAPAVAPSALTAGLTPQNSEPQNKVAVSEEKETQVTYPPKSAAVKSYFASPVTLSEVASEELLAAHDSQLRPLEAATTSPESRADTVRSTEVPAANGHALALLEAEILRLKYITKLQDQLLDHRDQQVKDLREQRDWLQRRLERSEEKSERDQLLLLAETQTIRKLIVIQSDKKTPFRHFLEWMGMVSVQKDSTQKDNIVEGTSLPSTRVPPENTTAARREEAKGEAGQKAA